MVSNAETIARRTMGEWELHSDYAYANPFANVVVDAMFVSPTGKTSKVPGFYDGEGTWRVRFNPNEIGRWTYRTQSRPSNSDLNTEGVFEVTSNQGHGFLQATPGDAWGFRYESGEPVFLLGDTVYNLFGMAYCGADVASFLKRRARQRFNLLRVRLPVSPFHPPEAYSNWQTRRTWPWGGSEQSPRFDRFNLEYFHTVDQVVREAGRLDLGLEMIMEAWGFEFPFNSRTIFVPEWEELWMRYLVARYDAFPNIYFWTLMNEYEYYPNGDWHYKPVADRWAMRVARWMKSLAQHGHIISIHNGPWEPPFAHRFAADPEAIDAILFQYWGTRGEQDGWLAAAIEEQIRHSLGDWRGSAIFAEYGYERNPDLPLLVPSHRYCDAEHTRRGAWRGAFCALGIIHGFENSWGPFMILDQDQPGLIYLLHLRHFFTEVISFSQMRPVPEIVVSDGYAPGHRPLPLSTADRNTVAVYLPAGGAVTLDLPQSKTYHARWYDPRTGDLHPATSDVQDTKRKFLAPAGGDKCPWDWALVLTT